MCATLGVALKANLHPRHVLSQLCLLHWLSSSLLLYELFLYIIYIYIYIYIYIFYSQNYIIYTTHNTILNLRYGHIYELY